MIVADIIIVLLLIITAFRSFSKGIVMQLAGLIALAGGILASYFLWKISYMMLQQWLDINPYVLKTGAVVLTTSLVMTVILLLGKLLSKVIHITPFGLIDSLTGMIFGAGQMVLFISFVIFALQYINPNIWFLQDEYLSRSYILPYIQPIAPMIVRWIF